MNVARGLLRQRRGVFMTIMAIIVMIFLFTYTKVAFPHSTNRDEDLSAERTRITAMNTYIGILESYIVESTKSAGYLALENLSEMIGSNYVNLTTMNDLNTWMKSCMILNNVSIPPPMLSSPCMSAKQTINYSLYNLTELIYSDMNINTTVTLNSITVKDGGDPYEVVILLNVSYVISDGSDMSGGMNFARWNTTTIINATLDVRGIKDPLYMYGFQNQSFVNNIFPYRRFNSTGIIFAGLNDTDADGNFTKVFYPRRQYIASKYGVCVLQRYIKNWSVPTCNTSLQYPCCGIESVVNWDELNTTIQGYSSLVNMSFIDAEFITNRVYNCNDKVVVGLKNMTSTPKFSINRSRLEMTYYRNVTLPSNFYNYCS